MKSGQRLIVFMVVVLVAAVSGCARTGHYGKGLYRADNNRWHAGYHTIRHGDTLYSIAFQYGTDYRELARWNGIKAPFHIYIGQRIRLIPPSRAQSKPPRTSTTSQKRLTDTPRVAAGSTSRAKQTKKKPKKSTNKRTLSWLWPTRGKLSGYFSSRNSGKKGIEVAGKKGQAIVAAESGTVVYAGSGLRGYGQLIILKHNDTYISAYAHNSRIRVKEEQKVKKGQRIADMGSSGSDNTILHFEIRRDGRPVNPLKFLPKR